MEETFENFVPLIKPSEGFEELEKIVINSGLCSSCGSCTSFCNRLELNEEGFPEIIDGSECTLKTGSITCSVHGSCYDNCPQVTFSMTELEKQFLAGNRDEKVGQYLKIIGVRSKQADILEIAQDGGAVTSLVAYSLEKGIIDAAITASREDDWKSNTAIVKDRKALLASAGTKYSRTPAVQLLMPALKSGNYRLAVVGTGCQTTAARRIHSRIMDKIPRVDITLIGLFCFESFPHDKLKNLVEQELNVKMEDVKKTDIKKGKFLVWTKDGKEIQSPVKNFDSAVTDSCRLCINFGSRLADLSIGSIGTPDGWSTVIIRSEKGLALVEKAEQAGYIEINEKNVDLTPIKKSVGLKEKKHNQNAAKRQEKSLFVPTHG
ncbi:MAG: Coenzyme F420 hydrogenase/dehydrogenase, beta subunit C-terminal domain [Candidatus Hodarchaeales archaeon]|jgi:coenzyme F420 hydrogenase subunit beta